MRPPTVVHPALPPPLPLAHGELGAEDARELKALKEQIRGASGLFCEGYKEKCLRRRLAVRMRARGVHRYGDYATLLDSDPEEYERLLAAVTINVSKFFRNPDVWHVVRDVVLPDLLERSGPVRIWSAGTATGEEPYTIAMLLREALEASGRLGELRRFRIEGTDLDAQAIERARYAAYPALAMVEMPAAARARWFEPDAPPFRVREEVRRMVRFTQGDLIREPARSELDLIFCRNVFIYFERELQEELLRRFAAALRPGGWLVLGKVETLLGDVTRQLEVVRSRERIYRKR
ncbi:MAG TPA: protein-glutamate O-methyltransferase CheR [Longimicrobiales bacterium]|nr:protein-glutamate O-methyltransferase CheR [Longimicrobiales bacterium]